MAYTPTTWATGDTVTATKLNKIEQGIANAGSAMIITDNGTALDKTFAEIYNAIISGIPCYVKYKYNTPSDLDEDYEYQASFAPVISVFKYDISYKVYVASNTPMAVGSYSHAGTPALWTYSATDSQSYPTFYKKVYVNSTTSVVGTENGH